jgi:hypothetical protein
MPGKQTVEQLQSHVGGLVRVPIDATLGALQDIKGGVRLLVSVEQTSHSRWGVVQLDLLIGGRLRTVQVYLGALELIPSVLELIGASSV